MLFKNRLEAGVKLAEKLKKFAKYPNAIILALPRGGVVVGAVVAENLKLPLDLVVPRKIGAPMNPEYAIGAITETGEAVWNEEERASVNPQYLERTVAEELAEAKRRLKTYRGNLPPLDLKDKTVILVDDGIATGFTMRAAIKSVAARKPRKLVVAVPVSSKDAAEEIKKQVDEFIALDLPLFFGAVGSFYEVFDQTSDEEVVALIKQAKH